MYGTVSSNPFVFDQLRGLGVSAAVWDDVLEELFDEPFGNIPGPFGFLLADVSGKLGPHQIEYAQPEGFSDHDFIQFLLKQSIEEVSGDSDLSPDDGDDCAEAIEAYCADRASCN